MRKGKKNKLKNEQQKKNLKFVLIGFALLCLILIISLSYTTYSLWNGTYSQNDNNSISSGCFNLLINDLDENNFSTAIKLSNAYPLTDETGIKTNPYLLTITNICDIPSEYEIVINEYENTDLSNNFIKYQIKKDNVSYTPMLLSSADTIILDDSLKKDLENKYNIKKSYILSEGNLNKNESDSYELRIWVDHEATNDAMNKYFEASVVVISTPPKEK